MQTRGIKFLEIENQKQNNLKDNWLMHLVCGKSKLNSADTELLTSLWQCMHSEVCI